MKKRPVVIILCGGKGERLRPLTQTIPKPLILIKGRPILAYLLDYLKKFNLMEIVVAAGYRADKIRDYFEGNHKDFKVTIVDSGDVDIINRIKDCSHLITDDFYVFYGDTLANVDLLQLQSFHHQENAKATITLYPLRSQYGLVEIDDDSVVIEFKEKPVLDKWINIGSFYFNYEVLGWMSEFTCYADFLEFMGSDRKIKGFRHYGTHITVNTIRELEEAEENIHEFTAQ